MYQAWEGVGTVMETPFVKEYRPDQYLAKIKIGCYTTYFHREKGKWTRRDLYITIQLWSKTAKDAKENYPKGTKVFARGTLDVAKYTDKHGTPRMAVAVNVGGGDTRLIAFRYALGDGREDDQLFLEEPHDPQQLFNETQESKEGTEDFV